MNYYSKRVRARAAKRGLTVPEEPHRQSVWERDLLSALSNEERHAGQTRERMRELRLTLDKVDAVLSDHELEREALGEELLKEIAHLASLVLASAATYDSARNETHVCSDHYERATALLRAT